MRYCSAFYIQCGDISTAPVLIIIIDNRLNQAAAETGYADHDDEKIKSTEASDKIMSPLKISRLNRFLMIGR